MCLNFTIVCVIWIVVQVHGGLGESKAVHINENYQKENENDIIVSKSKIQEKIYNISNNHNRQHSRNSYVPFNSLTFSDGTVTVPGFTTESVVESSTAWWKKSKKNKSTAKPIWQKTIAITSTTTTRTSSAPQHKIKSNSDLSYSKLPISSLQKKVKDESPANSLKAIYPTKLDYSNRPILQYLDSMQEENQMKNTNKKEPSNTSKFEPNHHH